MNSVIQGPMIVLRWVAVLVGVVAWLLIVPILELGRSFARGVRNTLPARPRRRIGAPADDTHASDEPLARGRGEPRRRVGSG